MLTDGGFVHLWDIGATKFRRSTVKRMSKQQEAEAASGVVIQSPRSPRGGNDDEEDGETLSGSMVGMTPDQMLAAMNSYQFLYLDSKGYLSKEIYDKQWF